MSQKSTKFDEFASLFRSVMRPHLEVEPLPLNNLLVVLDIHSDEEKARGLERVTESMMEHFKPKLKLFCPVGEEDEVSRGEELLEKLSSKLEGKDVSISTECRVCFASKAILAQAESFSADFILLPSLFGELDRDLEGYTLGAVVDKVLSSSSLPILLIEGDVPEPDQMWTDILLFIEDAGTAEPCLAVTRTLAGKAAEARMLHVIDQRVLANMNRALSLATELDTTVAAEALNAALKKDMIHYLEGAKELLDRTGHKSSFELVVGDPVEATRQMIKERGPHLVICNSVAPDQRLVDSVAYNLAAYLREVPLLLV